jgi:hypothetical protein
VVERGEVMTMLELNRQGDLPDIFEPFHSWRTASVASVKQYRCLNWLGVR